MLALRSLAFNVFGFGSVVLFAIVLLVTVSFRTALIVTLALLAADLAIAPVLSPLTTGTAAAVTTSLEMPGRAGFAPLAT